MLTPIPTPPLASIVGKDARVELMRTRDINDRNVWLSRESRMIYKAIRQKYAGSK